MFEVAKYRRQFEVLAPDKKNEVLQGLVGTIPVNTPIYDLGDLDRVSRFWKFDVELTHFNQREVFDLYTTAVEMMRQTSETGRIVKWKMKALVSLAQVSPHYRRATERRFKNFFESGVYEEYPLSRDESPVGVAYLSTEDLAAFRAEVLLPTETSDTGMFTPEGGLAIERDAFRSKTDAFLRRTVTTLAPNLRDNPLYRVDQRALQEWQKAFIKYHKQQP